MSLPPLVEEVADPLVEVLISRAATVARSNHRLGPNPPPQKPGLGPAPRRPEESQEPRTLRPDAERGTVRRGRAPSLPEVIGSREAEPPHRPPLPPRPKAAALDTQTTPIVPPVAVYQLLPHQPQTVAIILDCNQQRPSHHTPNVVSCQKSSVSNVRTPTVQKRTSAPAAPSGANLAEDDTPDTSRCGCSCPVVDWR
jgi:hypothetical protein